MGTNKQINSQLKLRTHYSELTTLFSMEKTWRWFGKNDKITLDMLRQIGVEGIVTALHAIPNGEVGTLEAINDLKSYIE